MNEYQWIMILGGLIAAFSSFVYIAVRIRQHRGGFFIMHIMRPQGITETTFDHIVFRDSVIKSMLIGYNIFAVENLFELIVRAETSFDLETLRVILSLALVLIPLYLIEDLHRFVRSRREVPIATQ